MFEGGFRVGFGIGVVGVGVLVVFEGLASSQKNAKHVRMGMFIRGMCAVVMLRAPRTQIHTGTCDLCLRFLGVAS